MFLFFGTALIYKILLIILCAVYDSKSALCENPAYNIIKLEA